MTWWPWPGPDDDYDTPPPEPLALEVEDTPNPIVATLLGPDGDPIFHVYERPRIPLGYQPRKEASRIERL